MSTEKRTQGQCEGTSPPLFTVNLIPCRPVLGTVIDLTLNLVLQRTITIETVVVIGGCTHIPARIILPSLNRSDPLISKEWGSQRSWEP